MGAGSTRRLDRLTVPDPLGRPAEADPWRDFREVERITLELRLAFTHSLGKLSRFFLALEERRLLGTRCPACGKVWMPPRTLCGEDLATTAWIELPPRGTLEAVTTPAQPGETGGAPFALGYVRIEGADTLLLQRIRAPGSPVLPAPGTSVKVVWAEASPGHPMASFWFEPA